MGKGHSQETTVLFSVLLVTQRLYQCDIGHYTAVIQLQQQQSQNHYPDTGIVEIKHDLLSDFILTRTQYFPNTDLRPDMIVILQFINRKIITKL